jgi:two-component system OmpR family sensor kinase
VSRLPIRLRLTLPFAAAMSIGLAAMGLFIYLRVGDTLLATVDHNLAGQLVEARQNAREKSPLLVDEDVTDGPTLAQVVRADGTVVESTPRPLPALTDHLARSTTRTSREIDGLSGTWRLELAPIRLDGSPATLIVGRSLSARAETLDHLGHEFLFAAPAALFLALVAGYGLAAAALRPVEAMRRRAAAVTAATPGQRLPVPAAHDEISALAVTLNDMLARLEASFEHERRFVADASHELRTPLALLKAELELALRRPRSREELESALASAAEETERLTRLAEDLLLIARADQGRLPIRPERLHADEVLERVRVRFAGRAVALGRVLELDGSEDPELVADPVRLEQAIGNLVDNALQHGAGVVTLGAHARDEQVDLYVTDEGPGLPPGFIARAFARFSRPDDGRSSGGIGLGLSIVELIARAHGGEAHVENLSLGGTKIWITLPAAGTAAETLAPPLRLG